MNNWKTIALNSNLIQATTDKAILIKLPKSELKFWHPAKLVRTSGKQDYRMTVSFTDDFTFKLFRNGKGQYNRSEKIEQREVTADQLIEMIGDSTI